MNTIPKHRSLISKFATVAAAAAAISFSMTGKARADEAASPAGKPAEGQIVQRVLDTNRSEEQTAEAIKGRLASPRAWNLAERIDVDYAALDRDFKSLAGTTPDSTADGVADAPSTVADFSNLSGDALDKAYVEREVKAHQAMLAAIDNQLLPAAKTDAVQRGLVDLRAEVAAHLEQAQSVQHDQWAREAAAQERAMISTEIGNGP